MPEGHFIPHAVTTTRCGRAIGSRSRAARRLVEEWANTASRAFAPNRRRPPPRPGSGRMNFLRSFIYAIFFYVTIVVIGLIHAGIVFSQRGDERDPV
jgi:hypothetical protein